MKLYAVKTDTGYLRKKDDLPPEIVALNKASVFSSLEESKALMEQFGNGYLVELTLTESVVEL